MGRNRMAYGLSFDLSCHHARHSDCILPSTYICLSSREQDSGTYLPLCPIGVSGCQFTAVAYFTSHHSIWVLWPLIQEQSFPAGAIQHFDPKCCGCCLPRLPCSTLILKSSGLPRKAFRIIYMLFN